MSVDRPMKVCIVYPYATWFMGRPCGGAEKQVGLLAQHLARRGNEVTFVALHCRAQEDEYDGVRVRCPWDEGEGSPWLRSAPQKLTSLKRLIAEVDADLYYIRGAQVVSRWVIAGAHALDAPALLGLASDRNLLPESGRALVPQGRGLVGRLTEFAAWSLLQRPALRSADAVIAQNEEQASRCTRMGLSHVLIPSIVEPPSRELLECEPDYDVVWAGNVQKAASRSKGVGRLLALVRSLPEVRFAVAGALQNLSVSTIVAELEESSNVELFGPLDYAGTQALIARSRLVLNTSPAEGFSNVMLEGWALGKPSVTLDVNPSGLLADGRWPSPELRGHKGALGVCAGGDIRELSRLILEALGDEAVLRGVGRRCRTYVAEVHDPDVVCARYEDLAAAPRFTPHRGLPTHGTVQALHRESGAPE